MSDNKVESGVLDEHSELIAEHGLSIKNLEGILAKQEADKNLAKNIEIQKEIQSHTFERAQAYDNAIIIAGYAGYFALFGLTKEIVNNFWTVFSALFLGISLSTYIAWQVGTMFIRGRLMLKYAKAVHSHPDRFAQEAQKFIEWQKSTNSRFQFLWYLMLAVAISTALIGALTLMFSFARYIIENLEHTA